MDLPRLNEQIARALGVRDLSNVTKVTLELTGNTLPTITVEKRILPGQDGAALVDKLQTVVEVLHLAPKPE